MTIDDSWIQDKGPSYVVNDAGDMRGVAWGWNAYGGLVGGLYFPWNRDQQFAEKLLDLENIDMYDATDFIVEGGALHVDGEGTLIATRSSVLNINRNPDFSEQEAEEKLMENLGVDKVIWLDEGMAFDETDGHIDDICFFVRPGEICISWTDDEDHPQYENLQAAYTTLVQATDAKNRKLIIHKIPVPQVMHITEEESEGVDVAKDAASREVGLPLAVTYINCFFVNGGILLPQYGDPMDDVAFDLFSEIMPDRKVTRVHTREWSLGGGNVHCMTLQQPDAAAIAQAKTR